MKKAKAPRKRCFWVLKVLIKKLFEFLIYKYGKLDGFRKRKKEHNGKQRNVYVGINEILYKQKCKCQRYDKKEYLRKLGEHKYLQLKLSVFVGSYACSEMHMS